MRKYKTKKSENILPVTANTAIAKHKIRTITDFIFARPKWIKLSLKKFLIEINRKKLISLLFLETT